MIGFIVQTCHYKATVTDWQSAIDRTQKFETFRVFAESRTDHWLLLQWWDGSLWNLLPGFNLHSTSYEATAFLLFDTAQNLSKGFVICGLPIASLEFHQTHFFPTSKIDEKYGGITFAPQVIFCLYKRPNHSNLPYIHWTFSFYSFTNRNFCDCTVQTIQNKLNYNIVLLNVWHLR